MATPTITSVTVNGNWATVNFSDASSGSYQYYVVTLASKTMQGLEWNFPNVPATGPLVAQMSLATLNPPFDPTQAYQITATGNPGGPVSPPVLLPNSTPAVTSVVVTATTVTASWADAYPASTVTDYTPTLWQGSGGTGTNFPDVPTGLPMTSTLALTAALSPGTAYAVSVTSSSSSGPVATSPQLPLVVSQTTCTTQLGSNLTTLSLSAPAAPGAPAWTAFAFTLYDGDTPIAATSGVAPAPTMTWNLPSPLSAGRRYAVTVAGQVIVTTGGGSSVTGPFGRATPVLVGVPALVGTPAFDGALLSVAWTPVNDPAVTGYRVALTGADTLGFTTGLETALVTPAALTGSDQVTVAATGPGASGPASTAATVSMPGAAPPPTVRAAVTDGKQLSVDWSPLSTDGVIGYRVAIGSTTFDTGLETTLTVPVTFAVSGASLTVASLTAAGAGTASSPFAIVLPTPTLAPNVNSASYDGAAVYVDWTPVAQFGVTGYSVRISTDGSALTFTTGCETTLAAPAVLDTSKSWTAEVTAINAAAQSGPSSTLAVTLPAVPPAPTVGAANYDGTSFYCTWNLVPGASGYVITLSASGGSKYVFNNGQVTSLLVQIGLDWSLAWFVTVASVGVNGTSAPSSPPTTVQPRYILTKPAMIGASYQGGLLSLSWNAVLDASVAAYYVVVGPSGGGVTYSQYVAGTSLAAAVALDPTQTYNANAAAVNAVTITPPGASIAVVATAPVLTAVGYAGTTLTVAWTMPVSVTGATWELALFDGGGLVASTTSGTSATGGTLTATLVAGHAYETAARVLVDGTTGPWSGRSPVLLDAPLLAGTSATASAVTATWSPVSDDAVSGYTATLSEVGGAALTSATVAGTRATLSLGGVTPGKQYQVTVQAIGGAAVGPASAALPAVIETVAPSGALYDGTFLTVNWAAAASTPSPSYLVEVLEDGAVVAAQASSATSTTLAVALAGGGSYSAQVRVVSGAAVGAAGSALALLSNTTIITSGTTDAMSGLTTVAWTSLPGATSYLLQAYVGGLPSGAAAPVNATSYLYPTALVRNSDFSVAVAGVVTNGSVTVTGAYGPQYFPPTIQPVISAAGYNGAVAYISWGLINGATGYQISVLESGNPKPVNQISVNAVTDSISLAPTINDPTQTYGTVVQALQGSDTGPPSAQQPIFVPGFYLSTAPATTYAPFLYPATTLAQVGAATLGTSGPTNVIYLPSLSGSGTLTLPITQGPFKLTANTDPSSKATFPIALTILGSGDAWSFSTAANRSNLQNDYVALLKQVETNGGVPSGIAALQQTIGRYLPQTFAETLYYVCGYDLAHQCAELRPGVVLRVALGDYLGVSDPNAQWLDGYVGGPVVDYDVGSYLNGGNWRVGFDEFVSTLVANGLVTVSAPAGSGGNQDGAADAADLYFSNFQAPFFRLFFPAALQNATSTGSVVPGANFALAAAQSYTALQSTTAVPSSSNFVAYFRGRAVLRLCVRVFVDGVERVVPLGTTVRNLLDGYGWTPPSTTVGVDGLTLARALGPAVFVPGNRFATGQSYLVRIDWKTMPLYGTAFDPLSLPLLPGDQLTISG